MSVLRTTEESDFNDSQGTTVLPICLLLALLNIVLLDDLPSLSQLLLGFESRKDKLNTSADSVDSWSSASGSVRAISYDGKPVTLQKRSKKRAGGSDVSSVLDRQKTETN